MKELAKIDSFRKDLAIAETIEEIKLIGDAAQAYQYILTRQGANKSKVDEIGEFDIEVECRKAEWLDEFYPHGADRKSDKIKVPNGNLDNKMPVPKKESAKAKKIKRFKAEKPELFDDIKTEIKNNKNVNLNSKSLSKEIDRREKERQKEEKESATKRAQQEAKEQSKLITDIEPGWHKIGNHFLYYGNNTDSEFKDRLTMAKFAFADPPYNAGVDIWDQDFQWNQDFLQDVADVVAVTPGGWNAFNFYHQTNMNYIWEMACWIKNGMTHGKCGYANFIKVSIFGTGKPKITQDHFSITIKINQTEDTKHKGRKPYDFMAHLIDLFTDPGDVVIDPFAGSGTTLIMCEEMNRISYNAELDKQYCIDIINRCISKNMKHERI